VWARGDWGVAEPKANLMRWETSIKTRVSATELHGTASANSVEGYGSGDTSDFAGDCYRRKRQWSLATGVLKPLDRLAFH
jgi:hypothetical protein